MNRQSLLGALSLLGMSVLSVHCGSTGSGNGPSGSTAAASGSNGTSGTATGTTGEPVGGTGSPAAGSGTTTTASGATTTASGSVVGGSGGSGTTTTASGSPVGGTGSPVGGSGTPATGSGSATGSSGTPATGSGSATGSSGTPVTGSGSPVGGSGTSTAPPGTGGSKQNDLYRQGTFVEPALTTAAAKTMAPDTTFNTNAKFNGGVQASVVYIASGPATAGCPTTGAAATTCKATTRTAGAGLYFASTSNDIYAMDETSGMLVWHVSIAGAGDGMRGTPVIDPASRTYFGALGVNGHHEVHALSTDDGSEHTGWPVVLSNTTLTSNGTAFNTSQQNEHGRLLFNANTGILYVPFGGHYGDGGAYRGWVVAINAANPTKFAGWVSADAQSGIWGHGGLASDGTGIFAETGNGHRMSINDANSDSEEVIRLTGMAVLSKTAANYFVSPNWQSMDQTDKDFGASTPAYVPLPAGSNPSAVLVAPAKPGHVYFLDATNLSSSLADLTVASTSAESVYTTPTIYTSASGIHAAIDVSVNAVCPGYTVNHAIISMLISPGTTPIAKETWCVPVTANTSGDQYNGPPISTTTDGAMGTPIVWFTNGTNAGAQLQGVDGETGMPVVTTSGAACTGIPNMSFPIAVNGHIVVAAGGHLCSWSPGGS